MIEFRTFGLVAALACGAGFTSANAQQIDVSKCVGIKSNASRLVCFDDLTGKKIEVDVHGVKVISVIDLKLDGPHMLGQNVATDGIIQLFADMLFLKSEQTDTNNITVEYNDLPRGEMKNIYETCGSFEGCNAKVYGKVTAEPYQKKIKIVASKIEIKQ